MTTDACAIPSHSTRTSPTPSWTGTNRKFINSQKTNWKKMEKLYKVVCANFAIANKHTGKCDTCLEDSVDEALMAFVGLTANMETAESLSAFLGLDQQII